MTPPPLFVDFVLLLGLSLFFGLAFEEFHAQSGVARPGGIRTFPLLALGGGILYRLDPTRLLPLAAGLAVLGAWLAVYYWQHLRERAPDGTPDVGLVVPVCNVLAYLIGPIAFAEPHWEAVAVTVAAVLLLTARERLHGLARQIELSEIVTAVKFLVLTGIVLPLLPDQPVTTLTAITPYQVWLALLAVTTVSYASYLVQRFLKPGANDLAMAVLGGLYSSTATTVVLARHARAERGLNPQAQAGIILATAVMYLRILVIVAVFNFTLARSLALPALALSLVGAAFAGVQFRRARGQARAMQHVIPRNPLELWAAVVFAALFVLVSVLAGWARDRYGALGLDTLAAVVGVTDVDPFVLSIAAGGTTPLAGGAAAAAILIAAGSNNLLKAAYTIAFVGPRASLPAATALVALGVGSGIAAWLIAGG
ncbi:MAG TPA: DUF4010 domain-containing protein [Stellaceae bacterium]|nr:DUF4010 domain-containing protein [Stellaceae bacterium]